MARREIVGIIKQCLYDGKSAKRGYERPGGDLVGWQGLWGLGAIAKPVADPRWEASEPRGHYMRR